MNIVIESTPANQQPASQQPTPAPQPAPAQQQFQQQQPTSQPQQVVSLKEILEAGIKVDVATSPKTWKGHAADVGKHAAGVALGGALVLGGYSLVSWLIGGDAE